MGHLFVTPDIHKEKIINQKSYDSFSSGFQFRSRFQQPPFIRGHITFMGHVDVSDNSRLPCNPGSGMDILTVANIVIILNSQLGRERNLALR
jgi:hypothetical protein